MLKGPVKLTEEIADKLFESGCSDGTPGMCNGIFSIDFHREADSLEEAIGSAVANLKAGGLSSTAWRSRHRQFPSAEQARDDFGRQQLALDGSAIVLVADVAFDAIGHFVGLERRGQHGFFAHHCTLVAK